MLRHVGCLILFAVSMIGCAQHAEIVDAGATAAEKQVAGAAAVERTHQSENELYSRIDSRIERKVKESIDVLNRLSNEHISFLTDKISFVSVLVTFVSTFFGLLAVIVTVVAGYKVFEWRVEMRELKDNLERVSAGWETRLMSLKDESKAEALRHYRYWMRGAVLQYKALNVTTIPPSLKKTVDGLRLVQLNSLVDYFTGSIKLAMELGRASEVLPILSRLLSLESMLKTANGPVDSAFIKRSRHNLARPCETKDLDDFVRNEKISPVTLKSYITAYDDFYKRFI